MNILLACDKEYYKEWAINCIKSILHFNPWLKVHIILSGVDKVDEIKNVNYVYDDFDILKIENPIPYFQAVRFIKCADLFPNNELVMSIDCDTVCAKSFTQKEFISITKSIHVQRHQKADRWMAGLVTYGNTNSFRKEYKEKLLEENPTNWRYGRDQDILNVLASKYNFQKLNVGDWMSFGRGGGTFLTLKGDQKISPGYLENYNNILKLVQ